MNTKSRESPIRQTIYLLIANAILSVFVSGFLLLSRYNAENLVRMGGSIVLLPIWGALLLVLRRGHVRFVKWFSVGLYFIRNAVVIAITGGINSPNLFGLLVVIIIATLMFGLRGTVITFTLSMVAWFAFSFLPPSYYHFSTQEILVTQLYHFFVILLFFYFSYRWLQSELNRNVQLNEKLALSESKMRALIMHLPLSAMIVRYNGEIDLLNDRMIQVLGYTREELKTTADWRSHLYFDSQVAGERADFWQKYILPPKEQLVSTEMEVYTKDGKRVDFEVYANFQKDEIVVLLNDITDRKRAEEQLQIQHTQILEAEQNRRRTLETMEAISIDLRKAEDKTGFYATLLEKCITLLGAKTGFIFEPLDGAFGVVFSQGGERLAQEERLFRVLQVFLSEFSESRQTVSAIIDTPFDYPTSAVKLFSEQRVFAFLVLLWPDSKISAGVQAVLYMVAEIGGVALDRMRVMETLEVRVKNRTRELQVLYDIMQLYVSNEDILYVIRESSKIFLNTTRADACAFYLADAGEAMFRLVGAVGLNQEAAQENQLINLKDCGWEQVLSSDKPVLLKEPLYPLDIQEKISPSNSYRFIGAPIRTPNGLLAVIGFLYAAGINVSLDELNLINLFSDQIGMVIERDILRQQLKNIAVIEERQRLSRELHDSLTQSLYSLKLIADAGKRLAKQQKWDEVAAQLDTIYDIGMQALKEMRLLVYELVSETIERMGLVDAIEQRLNSVERRSGVSVKFTHEIVATPPPGVQMNLYRIAQEALNNVSKHAAASKIELHIVCEDRHLLLRVSDNGHGFDPSNIMPGMGLKNMRERAKQLDGRIEIDSQPGSGTIVLFTKGERYDER